MRGVALLSLLLCAGPAAAIDRITISATQVSSAVPEFGAVAAYQVRATLSLPGGERSRLELSAARLTVPASITRHTGALTQLKLACENPRILEPDFACPRLSASIRSALLPPIAVRGQVALRSDTGNVTASGTVPQIAGRTLSFDLKKRPAGIEASLRLPDVGIDEIRKLAASRFTLPADFTLSGRSSLTAKISHTRTRTRAQIELDIADLSFQNGTATWIAEKVNAKMKADADLASSPLAFNVELGSGGGQFLGGVVLLDFQQNPLQVQAQGTWSPQGLQIASFRSQQRALAVVQGSADVSLSPFNLRRADVELEALEFPAAYTSYLQLFLATTPFNQLVTEGRATGRIAIANNLPVAIDLDVGSLRLQDDSRSLRVEGIASEVHWTSDLTGPPRPSFLAWESSQGWGIEGARTRLDFSTNDRSFRLLQPARLPFFDGALVINTFGVDHFGLETMEGVFDATIEPISVQPISKAMGWPEFAGQISGRIPGLTYRNQTLTLAGNLEATVFDGRVVASNLSVTQPLSAWPRLRADVVARNLDLELITRTFEFGSITGRVDVDLNQLETFNWSPTAFDLKIATPRGDRSRHRISQKAVQNLSNIGGGGGGVAAALQGGFLRFFDDFGYDRIGISCRLRNDVCQMDGVAAAGAGFYIVKGRGIPRIDIIGNGRRVDWPRMVAQVSAALANTDSIVVN